MAAKESTDARRTAHPVLQLMADRIRAAMDEQNETHRSLALRAGVSAGTVSNLLSGTKEPQLLTLMKVAGVLGFSSLDEVFGDIQLPTNPLLLELAAETHQRLAVPQM